MDTSSGKWKAWLPLAAWAVVLFALSSVPGTRLPSIDFSLGDKVVHVCAYAVFGALCLFALRRTTSWFEARLVLMSVLMAVAYGVSDELHQLFVPKRSFDGLDIVADGMGGTLGALGSVWLHGRRAATKRQPSGGAGDHGKDGRPQ